MMIKLVITFGLVWASLEFSELQIMRESVPQISSLYLKENGVLYISEDRKQMGVIRRSQGVIEQTWILSENEEIIKDTAEEILILKDDSSFLSMNMEQFNFQQIYLEFNETSPIISLLPTSYGFYYLTDQELSVSRNRDQGNEIELELDEEDDEELISLFLFNEQVILFSNSKSKYCFTEIDLEEVFRKICLPESVHESQLAAIKVSGGFLFLSTEEQITVVDRDFQVIENFEHEALQIHNGFVSISGFKTYHPKNKAFQDFKIVSEAQGSTVKLRRSQQDKQKLVLEGIEGKIGQIQGLSEQPTGAWIDKSQAGVDFTSGKYQFILQLSSDELQFYQIIIDSEGEAEVSLKWKIV